MSNDTTSADGPAPGRPEPDHPVRRLGEYHLLQKLGQGGMGAVFLAKRLGVGGFEKTFVVKCMLDALAGSPELVTMFFDEARLAARLSHPSIAQIYDFGVIDGTYYIAMEHIAGEDLSAIIRKLRERSLRIPVPIALRIMLELCAGLDYAHNLSEGDHALGIIHRDVSPSNVMVSYQGAVKLLDFGIAKTTSRLSETQTGGLKGKLSYLAPEQIEDDVTIDARVDIFCLGITLFKLLTGRHPFRRETEIGTMHAILSEEPSKLRELRDNLPDEVVAITHKALARDRARRYQSMAEMTVDLQRAMAAVAPGNSPPDLAEFMVTLFGREARTRRSHVPTLGEINLAEVVSPKSTVSVPAFSVEALDPQLRARVEAPTGVEPATTLQMPALTPLRRVRWALRRVRTNAFVAGAGALVAAAAIVLVMRAALTPAPRLELPPPVIAAPALLPLPPPPPVQVAPAPVPVVEPPPPRHPPRPRALIAEQPARLAGPVLQTVVARAQPRFVACFRTHAAALSAATGRATVELSVASSGKVTSAAARVPLATPALARCLEEEALALRFPRHPDRELRFSFPLVYRKGQ